MRHLYLYVLLSVGSAVGVSVTIFFLAQHEYRFAWIAATLAFTQTRLRIVLGGRVARTTLFYAHLLTAIPAYLGITSIVFLYDSEWLRSATYVLFLLSLVNGLPLWVQGIHNQWMRVLTHRKNAS